MCGGTLEINENQSTATCEYCGTEQTLPRLDDDKKANLYDRASHFRRNNEYDKAMAIYEQILSEDGTDAESYWSLVLCRYGIEYVEDPATKKRVPTVNRAQFTSIYDDDNYKMAIKNADIYQKSIYEEEANAINEIQKGILAISQKEEPFDVFICYKETDNNGRRTQDSVLANDLYHQLTNEGFKVFFSRITLEDKLGVAYEPYIFAALNSAKVMVVLGTRPEYFNAVWVKNEWSRYLALVKQSAGKKILIPAYRDMDPYDLPEEFSHLQAQDMNKLGFMQDLIRGIKKLVVDDTPKVTETVVINNSNSNIAPLLKRAFMYLEDGKWEDADNYCEKVLDQDPENAEAYLGKLMSELCVKKKDALRDQKEPFSEKNNYQKVIRFADETLKAELIGYIDCINNRNENARMEDIYNRAKRNMNISTKESDYMQSAKLFESISGYMDSAELAEECRRKAEVARKDAIYYDAKSKMTGLVASNYQSAIIILRSIPGWKDADEQVEICKKKIEEIRAKEEEERKEKERLEELERVEAAKQAKKRKIIGIASVALACVAVVFVLVLNTVIIPNSKYNDAVGLIENGEYRKAYDAFVALDGYKDSKEKAEKLHKQYPLNIMLVGDVITLGSYEQDNDTTNGKEAIEWVVLDTKGDEALVVSKYVLDCKRYNEEYESITWEWCTLRKWLNGEFLESTFTAEEKEKISMKMVSADANPDYNTYCGNDTEDKIFLLSIVEANTYFNSDKERQCEATPYAKKQGMYTNNGGYSSLWLRSPGSSSSSAAYVNYIGGVNNRGIYVNYSNNGVRPALWIKS